MPSSEMTEVPVHGASPGYRLDGRAVRRRFSAQSADPRRCNRTRGSDDRQPAPAATHRWSRAPATDIGLGSATAAATTATATGHGFGSSTSSTSAPTTGTRCGPATSSTRRSAGEATHRTRHRSHRSGHRPCRRRDRHRRRHPRRRRRDRAEARRDLPRGSVQPRAEPLRFTAGNTDLRHHHDRPGLHHDDGGDHLHFGWRDVDGHGERR